MKTLLCAIDQGTTSTRVMLFDSKDLSVVAVHQLEHANYFPKPGWVEHDPMEILNRTTECIQQAILHALFDMISFESSPDETLIRREDISIVAIGITNQRETTVVWDKTTGKPLYNAIVWNDTRTSEIVSTLKKTVNEKEIRRKSGLPISTYFSALKLKWLIDNVVPVQTAINEGRCLFGTIDSWLIWNLTGGVDGGKHVTDVTNASRTMLMDIETTQWDPFLCSVFGVPMSILPQIKSSAEVYGHAVLRLNGITKHIPITGCIGDQQSATVGQRCFKPGEAKNTYGTGCFMLMNTGTEVVRSSHGLLTTVCYHFPSGDGSSKPVYALEGSIAVAGSGVRWLRDQMGFFKEAAEIETIASSVEDTNGVVFVPAFSGLFAPYWKSDATGIITGLTQYSTKAHICRALLEAVCFQSRELLECMEKDAESIKLSVLKVDGGMTANNLLMQMQADILGVPVERPANRETTALGAAIAAGIGAKLWTVDTLPSIGGGSGVTTFQPAISHQEREQRFQRWTQVIQAKLLN